MGKEDRDMVDGFGGVVSCKMDDAAFCCSANMPEEQRCCLCRRFRSESAGCKLQRQDKLNRALGAAVGLILLWVVLFVPRNVCAEETRPALPTGSVVALLGERGVLCSGTLVAPRLVLSARHCHGVKYALIAATIASEPRRLHSVVRKLKLPHSILDVALFVLKKPSIQAPLPLYSRGKAPRGQAYAMGYGRDGLTGKVEGLKVLSLTIDGWNCEAEKALHYGCGPDSEFVIGRNMQDVDTCSGDSGGPVLVRSGDVWEVVGVTSRSVAKAVRVCGDGGIYVRADVVSVWVERMKQRLAREENER